MSTERFYCNTRITNGSFNATFNSNTFGSLYTTGGNIGINNTSPSYGIDIATLGGAQAGLRVKHSVSGSESSLLMSGNTADWIIGSNVGLCGADNWAIYNTKKASRIITINTVGSMLLGRTSFTNNLPSGEIALAIATTENTERAIMCIGNSATAALNWHMVNESGTLTWYYGNYAASLGTNVQMTNSGNMIIRGAYSVASDIRTKTNINTLNSSLDKILQLNPVSYNRRAGLNSEELADDRLNHGFIANEVRNIQPNLVLENPQTGVLSLDYTGIFTMAVKAIQELSAKVDDLQTQINALKNV